MNRVHNRYLRGGSKLFGLRAIVTFIVTASLLVGPFVEGAHKKAFASNISKIIVREKCLSLKQAQLYKSKADQNPAFVHRSIEFIGCHFENDALHRILSGSKFEEIRFECCKLTESDLSALQFAKEANALSICNESDFDDSRLIFLAGLENLVDLQLPKTGVNGEGLSDLHHLVKLRSLNLNGNKLSAKGLERLQQLPSLERLYLEEADLDLDKLLYLCPLSKVSYLKCNLKKNTDKWLAILRVQGIVTQADRSMAYLDTLDLSESELTDQGLAKLKDCPFLRWLNLSSTRISDKELHVIKTMPMLANLIMNDTDITDKGLEAFSGAPSLRDLKAAKCHFTGSGFCTDSGFLNLQKLHIGEADIAPDTLSCIGSLPKLTELWLDGCKLPAKKNRLLGLTRSRTLAFLSMRNADIRSDDINCLSGLKSLGGLCIGGLNFEDDIVDVLKKLRHLRYLSINSVRKMDTRLVMQLAKLKNLEELDLTDSVISPVDLDLLKAKLKGCRLTD